MRISDPTSPQDNKKKKYNQTNTKQNGELMPEVNQASLAISKAVRNIGDTDEENKPIDGK